MSNTTLLHDPIDSTWAILEEIKKSGSISFSAKLLGYSQSQISRKVQTLEHHLGIKLLLRESRGVRLTPDAERYLSTIHVLRTTWKKSTETIQGVKQITLGCHPLLAREYLGKAFPAIIGEFLEIDFKLKLLRSPEVIKQMASGEIQFGVVAGRIDHGEFIQKKIAEETVYVYAREKNSKNIRTLFYNSEMVEHQKVIRAYKTARLIEVQDYELIAEMAQHQGCGGILPTSCAKRYDLEICSDALMKTSIFWLSHQNVRISPVLSEVFRFAIDHI